MTNIIKALAVMLVIISFSLAGCQQSDKNTASAPTTTQATGTEKPAAVQSLTSTSSAPSTPPSVPTSSSTSASGTSGEQANKVGTALGIISVNVTSPSKEPVSIPGKEPGDAVIQARVWETLDLECITEDQASHKLTYTWSCSAGRIKGTGSKVIWTAPGAGGDYTVTVNVKCDQGETAELIIKANVKCCGN